MLIQAPAKDPTQRREMKVNLPLDLHLRLHAMKVRNGSRIADTIAAALEEYFAKERVRGDRSP